MTHHLKRFVPTAALTLVFLAGCGSTPSTAKLEPSSYIGGGDFDQVQSLNITETDTPSSVMASTGGVIVTWHPEDGYAMVGLKSAVNLNGAKPAKAYKAPESGPSWSQGWGVWGSGWNVWGSGTSSWGSGWTVWGSGTNVTRPSGASRFGTSVALSADGTTLAVGDSEGGNDTNGAVSVYTR